MFGSFHIIFPQNFTYLHTYIFQICVLCLFGCVFQTARRLQSSCLKRLSSLPGELSVILNNCLGRVWLWEWACPFVCPSVLLSATLFCDPSACPDKPSRRLISNLVDTFIMVLFKSHQLLVVFRWIRTISWSLICRAVSKKPLIDLSSTLKSKLIGGFPQAEWHLVTLRPIAVVSWPLIGLAASSHLQTNRWSG